MGTQDGSEDKSSVSGPSRTLFYHCARPKVEQQNATTRISTHRCADDLMQVTGVEHEDITLSALAVHGNVVATGEYLLCPLGLSLWIPRGVGRRSRASGLHLPGVGIHPRVPGISVDVIKQDDDSDDASTTGQVSDTKKGGKDTGSKVAVAAV